MLGDHRMLSDHGTQLSQNIWKGKPTTFRRPLRATCDVHDAPQQHDSLGPVDSPFQKHHVDGVQCLCNLNSTVAQPTALMLTSDFELCVKPFLALTKHWTVGALSHCKGPVLYIFDQLMWYNFYRQGMARHKYPASVPRSCWELSWKFLQFAVAGGVVKRPM